MLTAVALVAGAVSINHLLSVRDGYLRFDTQARMYMAKFLNNEEAVGIYLPHGEWHLDGTYLNHYLCLEQPDCTSKGTFFGTGYAADLFPVKLGRVPAKETPAKK